MALRRTYSLRALLITALAICLVLAYYSQSRDLRRAVEELRVLRDETGRLSVGDRSKVHAIAVATREPNTWQWRLFIPEGHRYSWNLACEDIPVDSVPEGGTIGASNEPYWQQDNEVLVTATLRQTSDHEWLFAVDSIIGDARNQMYGASQQPTQGLMIWLEEL